jgi:hypothetical protein
LRDAGSGRSTMKIRLPVLEGIGSNEATRDVRPSTRGHDVSAMRSDIIGWSAEVAETRCTIWRARDDPARDVVVRWRGRPHRAVRQRAQAS